jgi:hypothetical protein
MPSAEDLCLLAEGEAEPVCAENTTAIYMYMIKYIIVTGVCLCV